MVREENTAYFRKRLATDFDLCVTRSSLDGIDYFNVRTILGLMGFTGLLDRRLTVDRFNIAVRSTS